MEKTSWREICWVQVVSFVNKIATIFFSFWLFYFTTANLITFLNILRNWGHPLELKLGRKGLELTILDITLSNGATQTQQEYFFFYFIAIIILVFYLVGILCLLSTEKFRDWYYRIICFIILFFSGHLFLFACVLLNNMEIHVLVNFSLANGFFIVTPVKQVMHQNVPENVIAFLEVFLFFIYIIAIAFFRFSTKDK